MLANVLGPDGIIIIIVLAIVLIFGGSKLPSLARGLGSASSEFKKGLAEGDPTVTKVGDPTVTKVVVTKVTDDVSDENDQFVGGGSN